MKLSDYKNIKYINTQISDFCKIRNGYSFKSNLYSKSGIRVIRISDVQKGSISDNDIVFYPLNLKNEFENYLLTEKDILVSLTGNVGRVAMLKISNLPAALNQRVAAISTNSNVINKYLYYCISNDTFENQCYEASTGGAQKNLSTKWLANYVVPIPEIKVQEEIVKILDSFTNLIDALNEELSLRQKQFEYYREKLISHNASKIKTLNELSLNCDKKRIPITEKDRNKGDYPYYGASGIIDYIDKYIFDGKYLLISEDGNNLLARTQPIAFLAEGKFWVNNHAHILLFEKDIVRKFVQIYINSIDLSPYITGGAQPKLNQKNLNLIQIPIPENNIESIVEKLDAFESLISSVKEEIALRQKQYEYYREKLLTFD